MDIYRCIVAVFWGGGLAGDAHNHRQTRRPLSAHHVRNFQEALLTTSFPPAAFCFLCPKKERGVPRLALTFLGSFPHSHTSPTPPNPVSPASPCASPRARREHRISHVRAALGGSPRSRPFARGPPHNVMWAEPDRRINSHTRLNPSS